MHGQAVIVPERLAIAFMLLAAPAVAQPGPSWNCTLHGLGTEEREAFRISRQENGWYGDGKTLYLRIIDDGAQALVAASSVTSMIGAVNADVVGSQVLIINKRTHLARLSYSYLIAGYPDRTLYGACLPG